MRGGESQNPTSTPGPLRRALIVGVAIGIILGGLAAVVYSGLVVLSPCRGPGGPNCSGPEFLVAPQGVAPLSDTTYWCSFLISPASGSGVLASDLTVSVWNDSGSNVPLGSVTLFSTGGLVLANYSPSGVNWTTNRAVDLSQPGILVASSSTNLSGQYISVTDPSTGSVAHSPVA
jgi:hypothetical protein